MNSNKYTITHCHTMLSNGVTNIDSVTTYNDYIDEIVNNKSLNVNGICITEHGSLFEWYKKKEYCEKNGLKYVHAVEAYITESLDEKIRDNYHCCLYSRNLEGFKELNRLISKAFNREDGHYYYAPRITYDELKATSDNILITTACLGGILGKGNDIIKRDFINFLFDNKERCYLEVQHNQVEQQISLNRQLVELNRIYGIPLIVGTDTHCLNNKHAKGRELLQKSKNIYFDNEEGWDLTLKSYDELVELFHNQNIFTSDEIYEALENTNVLYNKIEEFKIDTSYKYPKLYDDSLSVLKKKINEGVIKRGVNKLPNYKTEYIPRIHNELNTYIHNGAVDFLLLDEDIKSWARDNKYYCGYSRGSCSGSEICYLIGITDIDSIKHRMNFERFMNVERVSLADIDTDWQPNHRELVKDYIYNKDGLYCADIITFNTVALKGSVRDVCKGLYRKNYSVVPKELMERYNRQCEAYGKPLDDTSKEVDNIINGEYLRIANYICENVELNEDKMRKEYPEVFEYVDIINGTIVSIGTHPCGQVVSPIPLDENMGLCSISTCTHPVSMIAMKSIDAQNYVKLDILGLDNIQLINETCELAGIDRLTPENTPDEEEVWKDIAKDNTLIFQWESDSAGAFLKTLLSDETINKIKKKNPNFKYIDLVAMGNGAIRPAGASYRDALSRGEFRDNGHEALNKLLAPTSGFLCYQEQILSFLHEFCGYTMGEADVVRRGFAKKTGTEQFIPKIKEGFKNTMKNKYGVDEDVSEELIVNFLQIIKDASDYLFSENHSVPYTYIGYIGGYLRYHYPLEFITTALNINKDKEEKTTKIIDYANSRGIKILSPKFGYSKSEYFMSKETNSIYKGIASIKNLNEKVANELYELSQQHKYNNFFELLKDIKENTSCNSRQLDILIKLSFFDCFGKTDKLLRIVNIYDNIYTKKQFKKEKLPKYLSIELVRKYANSETEKQFKDVDKDKLIEEIISKIPNKEIPINDILEAHLDYLGYIDYQNNKLPKKYVLITDINTKYTPVVDTYSLNSSVSIKCKISKKLWNNDGELKKNDIIYIHSMQKKFGCKKVGEKTLANGKVKPIFEEDQSKQEWWITNYSVIHNIDEVISEYEVDDER